MGRVNYKDFKRTPKKLVDTIRTLACNAAHLAALLKEQPYPAPKKIAIQVASEGEWPVLA